MSESNYHAPAVVDAPYEAEAADEGRRKLIAGGLIAALVLIAGGYFLLAGGSAEEEPFAFPPRKTAVPAKASASPGVKVVPPVTAVRIGRDPFRPLYTEPPPPAAPVERPASVVNNPGTTSGGTTSGGGDFGGGSPGGGSPGGGSSSGGEEPAPKTYSLVLKSVYGSGSNLTGNFSVDGKKMVAKAGSVFGPTSELKALSFNQDPKGRWVAVLQVGDGDPFNAPAGTTVYVG